MGSVRAVFQAGRFPGVGGTRANGSRAMGVRRADRVSLVYADRTSDAAALGPDLGSEMYDLGGASSLNLA